MLAACLAAGTRAGSAPAAAPASSAATSSRRSSARCTACACWTTCTRARTANLQAVRDDVELLRGSCEDPRDARRAVKGVEYALRIEPGGRRPALGVRGVVGAPLERRRGVRCLAELVREAREAAVRDGVPRQRGAGRRAHPLAFPDPGAGKPGERRSGRRPGGSQRRHCGQRGDPAHDSSCRPPARSSRRSRSRSPPAAPPRTAGRPRARPRREREVAAVRVAALEPPLRDAFAEARSGSCRRCGP